MTIKTTKKVSVKVYAMASTSYECINPESVHEKFCDIHFSTYENSDERDDIGADDYRYSVDGKDEMVIVDKGLLEALVDQCQRLSSNEAVYDDTRKTSFSYADLNKLVMGMKFPEEVTNHKG